MTCVIYRQSFLIFTEKRKKKITIQYNIGKENYTIQNKLVFLGKLVVIYFTVPNTTTTKNNTQTAVINIINLRIIFKLDVSYASQHTFSKVTVTNF